MKETPVRDDEVLALRVQGKSFAGIAKSLGFTRPSQANEAFNRALRRKPSAEQEDLRRQELARLDALIEGVRGNADLAPDDLARRLRSVERLRTKLLAD
jgi:AraC-like DNA-binding protein